MKQKSEKERLSLEAYLAGKQPLQPGLTALPTDEELDAAEAKFDRIIRKRGAFRPRLAAALFAIAAMLVLAFILWPERPKVSVVPEAPAVVQASAPTVQEAIVPAAMPDPQVLVAHHEKRATTVGPKRTKRNQVTLQQVAAEPPLQEETVVAPYEDTEGAAILAKEQQYILEVEQNAFERALAVQQENTLTCLTATSPS